MSRGQLSGQGGIRSPEERHERAVARTLEFAEEAAGRGDFPDALAWLQTLEAIGRVLPMEYLSKREAWRLSLSGRE
jgi:hypothetical protein